MIIPDDPVACLASVMNQVESDLKQAHAELMKTQGLKPDRYTWPEWTPQANTLRWFIAIREKFGITAPEARSSGAFAEND